MRRSGKRWVVVVSLIGVAAFSGTPALRAGQPRSYGWSGPVDSLRVAQSVFEAFFPELKGHQYPMLMARVQSFDKLAVSEQFLRDFDIEVKDSVSVWKPMTQETIDRHLLVASVRFSRDGSIESIHFKGRANRYLEHQALVVEMGGHPDWPDARIRAAMQQGGMRFAPDREEQFLMSVMPALNQFAAALGGSLQIAKATFELRVPSSNDPAERAVKLEWRATCEISSQVPGRFYEKYALLFEPIGATLQSIMKIE